jgi:exodeoxyribonuclease-3
MAFEEAGYKAVSHGQKTYNGVAWITRDTGRDVVRNIPGLTTNRPASLPRP